MSRYTSGDKWDRLQKTVNELLDRSADYVDTVVHVVDAVWTAEQRREADAALAARDDSCLLYTVLMDDFNVREHFAQTDSHREFVVRSYDRLAAWLPAMRRPQADRHDLSKYSLAEAVGYTQRWVHGRDGGAWRAALGHHYLVQPHHPQHFTLFRCGDGRMTPAGLQESLVDMVACRWERQLAGRLDISCRDLVAFQSVFLDRYVEQDRVVVEALMAQIAQSGT